MSKLRWFRRWYARPAAARPARRRDTARPALEALEDRCLLSAAAFDPTFNDTGRQTLDFPGGSVTGRAVAVQPDNKVIVAALRGTPPGRPDREAQWPSGGPARGGRRRGARPGRDQAPTL
jgi:hypothetical protein